MNRTREMMIIVLLLAFSLTLSGGILHSRLRPRGPFLRLTNKSCDFGEVDYDQEVSVVVPFANAGTERLVINQVDAGCKCILCEADKPGYEPGETGCVRIKFAARANPAERLTKTLRINSNDAQYPVREVTIQGRMAPSLSVFPREIDLGNVSIGSSPKAAVVVSSLGQRRPFQILSAATDLPGARIVGPWDARMTEEEGRDITIADATAYRMRVELSPPRTVGSLDGSLTLRTTSEISPEISVRIKGTIVSSLVARPASLLFWVDGGTQHLKKQVTVSSEHPFTLVPPRIPGPIHCAVDSESRAKVHSITCELAANDCPTGFKDVLYLGVEGHPFEETLTIPFAVVIPTRVAGK